MTPPTMRDVAERACVSLATVSRVFTNTIPVSPELQAAVQSAAKELGYAPGTRRPRRTALHRIQREPLENLARWLVSLEDCRDRDLVTLPTIIERAKEALERTRP